MEGRRDELIRFREALDNATDAIGMSTPDGRHYYQNRAFNELFGDIGEDPRATLYCDEVLAHQVFDTIMAGGSWSDEVKMYDSRGGVRDIHLRAYAGKDGAGRVTALVGIHTDITDRKKAEMQFERSVQHFKSLASSVPGIVYDCQYDRSWTMTYLSHGVQQVCGYPASDFVQNAVRTFESIIHPEDSGLVAQAVHEGTTNKRHWEVEYRLIHRDGGVRQVFEKGRGVTDAAGEILFLTGIILDITERRLAEERLRQEEARAQEAHKRVQALEGLGTVAGGLAHDFNNLLMGIFGNIELARMALPDGHQAVEAMDAASGVLERARQLTARLLTFARGGSPVLETVDLKRRIQDSVEFHLAGSKVAASYDISGDLWPVKADKSQIVEVIANLVINARDAMPEGGTLFVGARNLADVHRTDAPDLSGDVVELVFRDEGFGIPEDLLEQIFTPYFSTKEAGSGLGLAIVHGVVRRHKGHVSVASTPGVGTTFTVLLPADRAAPTAQMGTVTAQEQPSISRPVRILVMDDQEVIRTMAALMLERLGYVAETAAHGLEAIELYQQAGAAGRPFDLTIMDLTVPGGMGGQEAVQRLLAIDPKARVVVSSGYSSDPIMADYAAHGFAGCLPKPYNLNELNRVVSGALKR